MCGFAGLFFDAPTDSGDALRARIARMTATIVHRGPDAETSHVADFCAVGFRRLAIIDLTTGDQPVANADGSVQVFFNGEIYNHLELRKRLRDEAGIDLRHGSDGVVLPHLYERHGPDFVHLLNGMFAICVIDKRSATVRLYRDRFGIKPLYWAARDGLTVFGSELKPLFASGYVPAETDPGRIVPFLENFYVPGDATLARGVKKLMPGEELLLARGKPPARRRWYRLEERRPMRQGANLDELDALLGDAVRSELIADVPVGISLSGGIDSGLIAHYARKADVRAYTVTFPDTHADELTNARKVAAALGLPHVVVSAPEGDFLADLDETAQFNDEPVADPAFYSSLLVARAAAQHVKVLLSGTGADELFGGYGHYGLSSRARAYTALTPVVGPSAAAALLFWHPPQERRTAVLEHARNRLPLHAVSMTHLTAEDRRELSAIASEDPLAEMRSSFRAADWMDGVNQQLYVDMVSYLPHQLFPVLDRTTMAASIEGRVPYVDHRVVELCFSIPGEEKYRGQHGAKRLLRELARRHLPPSVATRRKHGFPSSVSRWLAPERIGEIRERLLESGGLCEELLPGTWVRRLVDSPESLAGNSLTVHSLLVLQAWHRAFVRGQLAAAR